MPRRTTVPRKLKYEVVPLNKTVDRFVVKVMLSGKRGLAERILREALARVIADANSVIRAIAEAGKYDLILQESVYFSKGVDITDQVQARDRVEAEQKMALTKNLKPTTFFAKDVWVRGITDVTIVKNDKAFIDKLSVLGDIYINDAFSAAHRAHRAALHLAPVRRCASIKANRMSFGGLPTKCSDDDAVKKIREESSRREDAQKENAARESGVHIV